MAWAKLHTDILGDPKLMRAARKGAKGLQLLPWFIAFAKEAADEGRLTVGGEPADAVDIAALIPNTTAKAVGESLSALRRIGVLVADEDGALRLEAWERRSGAKPSDGKEAVRTRVYRHRENKRNAESNADDVTPGNAIHVTPSNATEEKRGEKKRRRREKILPSGGAGATPDLSGNGIAPDQPLPEIPAVDPPQPEKVRGGWPAQVSAAFAAKGVKVDPGYAGAKLEMAVGRFNPERIVAAVEYFLEFAAPAHDVKPQFVTLNEFAKTPAFWVEQIMPAGTRP